MTTIADILEGDIHLYCDRAELQSIIEDTTAEYNELVPGSRQRKEARNRINEIIDEYNEQVGSHIYNHIK